MSFYNRDKAVVAVGHWRKKAVGGKPVSFTPLSRAATLDGAISCARMASYRSRGWYKMVVVVSVASTVAIM